MQDDCAAALYADARARGKRNPHATRIVARAWLRVIWACWTSGQPYNPDRHHSSRFLHRCHPRRSAGAVKMEPPTGGTILTAPSTGTLWKAEEPSPATTST